MNPCVISTPLDCFWDGASLLDETCQELAVYVIVYSQSYFPPSMWALPVFYVDLHLIVLGSFSYVI